MAELYHERSSEAKPVHSVHGASKPTVSIITHIQKALMSVNHDNGT